MHRRYLPLIAATFLVTLLVFSCDWPYGPEQQLPPEVGGTTQVAGAFSIKKVNTGQQICNPSISQDETNYEGCMLWLGFSGILGINNPPAGYTTSGVEQHDRLTISDTANEVKWFITRPDDIPVQGDLQDPEWSTHPDYIVTLGQVSGDIYDGYAVRISDKSYLKFCDGKFPSVATPHIWLPDSASGSGSASSPTYDANGFVDRESIKQFFGTYNVKIVYSLRENGLTMYYMDYTQSNPSPVKLTKPEGKDGWKAESPLISPDGDFITFNIFEQLTHYDSYVQELTTGSQPKLVAEGAAAPHWWVHPDDASLVYIVYATLKGTYFVGEDLTDSDVLENATAGTTIKQQVKVFPGRVGHASFELVGSPVEVVKLPFKGGMSPSGKYLCTGYANAYILAFNR